MRGRGVLLLCHGGQTAWAREKEWKRGTEMDKKQKADVTWVQSR